MAIALSALAGCIERAPPRITVYNECLEYNRETGATVAHFRDQLDPMESDGRVVIIAPESTSTENIVAVMDDLKNEGFSNIMIGAVDTTKSGCD